MPHSKRVVDSVLKVVVKDSGIIVLPPSPLGMDNMIAQNDRVKQKRFKS